MLDLKIDETQYLSETEKEELNRLRKENQELKQDNEILRRFAAMLSENQN